MTPATDVMQVHRHFEATCRRVPDRTALVCGEQRWTYRSLARRVGALAALLETQGVGAEDRVVLFLDNSVEFAVAVHAVLSVGATFVPISPLVKADKLTYILNDTQARALLTHATLEHVWRPALARCTTVSACVAAGAREGTSGVLSWPADEDGHQASSVESPGLAEALAAILYTSGTTGVPKGVMLTHLNMSSAWDSVQSYLQLREDDVIGLALPCSFSYGLYYLLMGLGLGITVVLERAASLPATIVRTLARERVTVFPGVPTLFSAILELSTLPTVDLSALRIVTNAAAPLHERHVGRLRERLPDAQLFLMYGMTECKRITYLPPEQLSLRPTSVGRGMPGQDHWIVDEQGVCLPNGATGELVVAGNHVMRGYWRKPQETAERLKPGRGPGGVALHTGDIFRTDEDGWLYFVTRRDDLIKSSGGKIAPREVETVLGELDAVLECAVVGAGDELLGQFVKAFIVLKPGAMLTEREAIRHCRSRLENYMVPKSIVFVADLPRTDSGKIRTAALH